MNNPSLRSVAVASMLFGGTLGAQAGVVAFGGSDANYSRAVVGVYEMTYNTTYSYNSWSPVVAQAGTPFSGPLNFSSPTWGSATVSQFTSNGFSATTAFTNLNPGSALGSTMASVMVKQAFTMSEAMVMTWRGVLGTTSYLRIDKFGGPGVPPVTYFDGTNPTLNLSATAEGEYYMIQYFSSDLSGSGIVFSASFAAVPAPGAVALIGLAGMVAGRRRRG